MNGNSASNLIEQSFKNEKTHVPEFVNFKQQQQQQFQDPNLPQNTNNPEIISRIIIDKIQRSNNLKQIQKQIEDIEHQKQPISMALQQSVSRITPGSSQSSSDNAGFNQNLDPNRSNLQPLAPNDSFGSLGNGLDNSHSGTGITGISSAASNSAASTQSALGVNQLTIAPPSSSKLIPLLPPQIVTQTGPNNQQVMKINIPFDKSKENCENLPNGINLDVEISFF